MSWFPVADSKAVHVYCASFYSIPGSSCSEAFSVQLFFVGQETVPQKVLSSSATPCTPVTYVLKIFLLLAYVHGASV